MIPFAKHCDAAWQGYKRQLSCRIWTEHPIRLPERTLIASSRPAEPRAQLDLFRDPIRLQYRNWHSMNGCHSPGEDM